MIDLEPDYVAAVAAHVHDENEASLSRAYDLGREALAGGLGILDVLSLHNVVQKALLLDASPSDRLRIDESISSFFREFLSPFEMSFRGYREANQELKRVNDDLRAAYAELQAKQLQLVQSAKMASLGELVAGIAHEINNPLAFVISHLHTVAVSLKRIEAELGEQASEAAREQCARARSRLQEGEIGVERIADLVLKLRTFSRLDEGEQKTVSIQECVASVLTILSHRFENRIRVEKHFGSPDLVHCFPSLLNQAIMNLLSNAIDAIEGEGVISITTGADAGNYVIVIADTGHGIPANLRERVLEPFFTTKPVGRGTGLGLSITYSIIAKHQGTLELCPAEGGGTVATIRFPMTSEVAK